MSDQKQISNLPSPSSGGLGVYLSQIKKFPMLDAEEEYMLAKKLERARKLKGSS